jgi:anti-sigma B factor antagonist
MDKPSATMVVRQVNDRASIIDIHGELTAAAENALMDAYTRAGTHVHAIVLNFGGLDYMNSTGIGLLVTFLIRVNRQKQRLLAYGLNQHYCEIFKLTRLDEAMGIHASESDALAAVA